MGQHCSYRTCKLNMKKRNLDSVKDVLSLSLALQKKTYLCRPYINKIISLNKKNNSRSSGKTVL